MTAESLIEKLQAAKRKDHHARDGVWNSAIDAAIEIVEGHESDSCEECGKIFGDDEQRTVNEAGHFCDACVMLFPNDTKEIL